MAEIEGIESVSRSIVAGRVMFLVGSGFSIDSEDLRSNRLMARLLLRFEGLVEMWRRRAVGPMVEIERLETELKTIFWLRGDDRFIQYKTNVDKLTDNYYQANSWFCSAYGDLLHQLYVLYPKVEVAAMLSDLLAYEEQLRVTQPLDWDPNKTWQPDEAPFRRLDEELLSWAGQLGDSWQLPKLGKVLFLDTQGFADSRLMAGEPTARSLAVAKGSYRIAGRGRGSRLRPRHHLLARWAREGYLPAVQTTNFDQLIDGAYRLAGMPHAVQGDSEVAARIGDYTSISRADEFFHDGSGGRRVRVMKFHGCAGTYRKLRHAQGLYSDTDKQRALLDYVSGLVFTFSDILHWRDDGWARDQIRSEMRSKRAVLAGFSGSDPVIFDTFRSCYAEVERCRTMGAGSQTELPFVFCKNRDSEEFAARELISYAESAVGRSRTPFGSGDGYLPFVYSQSGKFPDYDQLFQVLNHFAYRQRQRELLNSHLELAADSIEAPGQNAISMVADCKKIITEFEHIVECERAWIEKCLDDEGQPYSAEVFEREIVGWTYTFHPALLREWAIHYQRRATGSSRRVPALSLRQTLYYPMEDEPLWTVGAILCELALRQMIAYRLTGNADEGLSINAKRLVLVANGLAEPVLHYATNQPGYRTRRELRLSWDMSGTMARHRLHLAPPHSSRVWQQLHSRNGSVNRPIGKTPEPIEIWKYASMDWKAPGASNKKLVAKLNTFIP